MDSIVELWNRSQELESRGNRDEARSVYESILAREPYHVPARLRMSRLEQIADRYGASKEHALQAADAVSMHSATRNIGYVTARLLDFAEEERAAAIIIAADPSDPNVIRQSPALAQQLWLAGKYQEALRFLDAMKKHVSVHPLLTLTRANVLRFLGDMERAEQEYEATLRMSPDMADAHWLLSTHTRSQPLRVRIPRIQAALSRSKDATIEQAHLCYALFREFDAAGDINEAWFSLKLGAHIMKQRLSFDAQAEEARLDAWMQGPELAPISTDVDESLIPVFIVGMPRTGTTLLDRILGNHPDVESLGERNDLSAAVSEASDFFFRSALTTDCSRVLERTDFARAGELYLERLRRVSHGTRFVIDKNPLNLFNIPVILRALPAARILCLQRDPMDACFSNFKELFQGDAYPYSYDLDDVAHHYRHATKWASHWQSITPRRVALVSYEKLVSDTAVEVERVTQFLGLAPQDDLQDIKRNEAPVATASSSQVREDIHGRGVGAWKKYERHLQSLQEQFAR
jgi:tetratricopeptide (TPR) repeat protein